MIGISVILHFIKPWADSAQYTYSPFTGVVASGICWQVLGTCPKYLSTTRRDTMHTCIFRNSLWCMWEHWDNAYI